MGKCTTRRDGMGWRTRNQTNLIEAGIACTHDAIMRSCSKRQDMQQRKPGNSGKDQTQDCQTGTENAEHSRSDSDRKERERSSFMYKIIKVVTSSRLKGDRASRREVGPILPDGKWKE